MKGPLLAIAEHAGEFEDAPFARRQQFLGREFRRGMEIERSPGAAGGDQFRRKGVQMGLVSRRNLQCAALHFDEILCLEPGPDAPSDPPARQKLRPAVGMDVGCPPGRGVDHRHSPAGGSGPWPGPARLL